MKRLTLPEVVERVTACIESGDTEGAHVREDELHFEFFHALADGRLKLADARAMAKEFLRAESMERWYA